MGKSNHEGKEAQSQQFARLLSTGMLRGQVMGEAMQNVTADCI